tara:strand:+ start:125 stop:391 length:267 start_codon:yes stop_codon:yes gene_type:complete
MTEEKVSRMAYRSELIRTVSYVGKSPTGKEWESTLLVKTTKLDDDEYIIIRSENSEDTGTFIWSEAQAKELFRAIKTAGEKIGWFENA